MTAEPRPAAPPDRLLAWPRVADLTGVSRTTAWRLRRAGDFPDPVALSPGRVGWRESEVAAWLASRGPRGANPAPPRRGPAASPPPPAPAREARPAPASTPPTPPDAGRTRRLSPRAEQLRLDL